MKERILEVDFVKGILISLMVLFHFKMFVNTYSELTSWVYSFHMSGFLLISGYFQRSGGTLKQLFVVIRKIFLPYAVFEALYLLGLTLLGSILGSQNQFDFSIVSVCKCLFLSPIGTYWYLHTLFICVIISYVISWLKFTPFVSLVLTGSILFVLTLFIDGLLWGNVIYFLIGSFLRRMNLGIIQSIVPSMCSLIPVLLISCCAATFSRADWSGLGLTFFMLSFLMGLYSYLPLICKHLVGFIGRNSFCIVLFSPIFTVLTKQYDFMFTFDRSNILWAIVSLILVLSLCLLSAWLCDKLKISKLLVGNQLYCK